MSLETFWFCLIAVLWGGYLLLEGFDFGVGLLLPFLPRDERERRVMFETIGPVWDMNEVWLVVAVGATFAAFPVWYGTLFAAVYPAVLVVLVCLIVRVVSFEWRERRDGDRWRTAWQWANTLGSAGAAFVWGLVLANLLHGLPLTSGQDYGGDALDLISPYTVFAGLLLVLLFAFHGAGYLALRTTGDLRVRASATARVLAVPALIAGLGFLAWTVVLGHATNGRDVGTMLWPAVLGGVAYLCAAVFALLGRERRLFAMTALAIALTAATLFTSLYPRVLVSSPDFANSLTIANAASEHYAMKVITVVAAVLTPVVLLYQGWTWHVLRGRVGGEPL
jgi:cytochrome d ubiquinol oxidase subunit II